MKKLQIIFSRMAASVSIVFVLFLFAGETFPEDVSGSIYVESGAQIMKCGISTFKQGPTSMTVVIPDSCSNVISPIFRWKDMSESHWAFWYADALAYAGITQGCGDGKFCPDAPVTRAELAVMLSRALELKLRNGVTSLAEEPAHEQ